MLTGNWGRLILFQRPGGSGSLLFAFGLLKLLFMLFLSDNAYSARPGERVTISGVSGHSLTHMQPITTCGAADLTVAYSAGHTPYPLQRPSPEQTTDPEVRQNRFSSIQLLITALLILLLLAIHYRQVKRGKRLTRELINAKSEAESSRDRIDTINRIGAGMLERRGDSTFYSYLTDSLCGLFPGTIVLYISVNEEERSTRLESISGAEKTILSKATSLAGFNPEGSSYELTVHHLKYFRTGKLIEFEGGLAEFSAGKFPAMAANMIEKGAGIKKIYTIGINRGTTLLGAVHLFMRRGEMPDEDTAFIETIVSHAGLIVQNNIAHNELKHSYRLMQYIIEHNRSAVALLDGESCFIYVSRSFIDMYELGHQELRGKKYSDLLPHTPGDWSKLRQGVMAGGTVVIDECRHTGGDGSEKILRWECRPWYGDNGAAAGLVVYTEDITARKRAERELLDALERAEESNRLKTAFLQNMSHEVRTPLNAIVGFSQLMARDEMKPEERSQLAGMLIEGSDRLISTVSDVIEMSEIKAGLAKTAIKLFDPVNLTESCTNKLRDKAAEKGVKLSFINLCRERPLNMISDSYKVERAIKHLTENAVKFTPDGKVDVRLNCNNGMLSVEVDDSGIGISEQEQSVIFEPFRQLETDISSTPGGNGLGLAISLAYARMLGGDITLVSEPNRGSTFTLLLPLQNRESYPRTALTEPPLDMAAEEAGRYSSKRVLVADADTESREMLASILGGKGAEVILVSGTREAIDACRNNQRVDLIIIDPGLSKGDGTTAARLIREFRRGTPVVALAADNRESLPPDISSLFDDFIERPVEEQVLLAIAERYL